LDRRRAIIALLTLTALALAVVGAVIWGEMSPSLAAREAQCAARSNRLGGCGLVLPPSYRLHPLRAELLWAAAGLLGLAAAALALRPRIGRRSTLTLPG
jgi:hypothetical protein